MVRELLWPRTDLGVLVQVVLVLAVFPPLIWWARRRNRDVLLFVSGLFVFGLGFMALRAVH